MTGAIAMRFFFDFTGKNHSLNVYQGVEFRTFDSASEYANAITDHMRNRLGDEWTGLRVDVRNPPATLEPCCLLGLYKIVLGLKRVDEVMYLLGAQRCAINHERGVPIGKVWRASL